MRPPTLDEISEILDGIIDRDALTCERIQELLDDGLDPVSPIGISSASLSLIELSISRLREDVLFTIEKHMFEQNDIERFWFPPSDSGEKDKCIMHQLAKTYGQRRGGTQFDKMLEVISAIGGEKFLSHKRKDGKTPLDILSDKGFEGELVSSLQKIKLFRKNESFLTGRKSKNTGL